MENNEISCKQSTRKRILEATLEIIGEEGIQNVTIKKIARIAGVNIAAVNYHFGSKDNVINTAMNVFADKLKGCFQVLEDKTMPPKERIKVFLQNYSDTALQYPYVFKNIISHSICNHNMTQEYVEFLTHEGFNKIVNTLKEAGVNENGDVVHMRVFQMLSALEFPLLLGEYTRRISGVDYEDNHIRNQYIEVILKTLIS